ncbi:protein claret segregational [Lutzomyia longipalpis]|uniref:protein claret segregational n=1 Tax=Lutzomyia longipalpis TaxID=7200 RepID=UPI002483ECAC|nr:protein claret segregational [Lutzomyia longipalpis]
MNRRLDKPSGIPKPALKTAGFTASAKTIAKTVSDAKMPLTRDLANLPAPRRRALSPDLQSRKVAPSRTNLRRSRSFNDIRDIGVMSRVNPLKRTAPTMPSIPAKRVATSVQLRTAKPAVTGTATTTGQTTTKPKPAAVKKPVTSSGAVTKVGAKKIPPYDYKARYGALLEKHNALKEKFDEHKEQLVHLEGLPEQYEESQAEVQRLQLELAATKTHYECLEKETKISAEKIQKLTSQLESTAAQLEKITATCQAAQENEKKLQGEVDELTEENKWLKDEGNAMREELNVCKDQLFASVMERKDLHNQMMDLRGNIRVFCRVRPALECETERILCGWRYIDEASLEITSMDPKNKGQRTEFSFDQVFHPLTSQTDVFENVTPLIQSALDGYNVCIFAYGQTGSGKTFTMEGTEGQLGVIPRTVDLLFDSVKNYKRIGWEYEIRATFLEIYNEVLYDLLNPEANDLEIRMVSASSKTDVYVSNITEKIVENGQQLRALMDAAKRNRATACTVGNERSSRSHAITRLQLIGVHEGKQEKCVGTVNLVDLAGSESPKTSTRMEETKKINRSLSELTNVIMAILNKQEHVPYRNSKLTHLLMPALGGNSKTLMVINVSPLQDCYGESLKSLRFAASVNSIKMTRVRKNRYLNNVATTSA